MNKLNLHYNNAAENWNEALPFGNGRLGGMLFGKVVNETIQLNEDSIWYGGEKTCNNQDSLKYINEIRRLLFEGKPDDAVYLSRMALYSTPKYFNPYLPLCNINIYNKNQCEKVDYYKRQLDIENAVTLVNYTIDGVTFSRETFSSFEDNVIIVRITADKKSSLTFSTCLTRRPYDGETFALSGDSVVLNGECGKDGVSFSCMLNCLNDGGTVKTIGDYISVENADSVTLIFAANSTYRVDNPLQECKNQIEKARAFSYHQLKLRHISKYQSLFNSVQFELYSDEDLSYLPTNERLDRLKNGKEDIGLTCLYFQFGRYLLISSSMPNCLPANLQGIWNASFTPAWESKYTININLQMNYWLAEICNLSQCHTPLFDLIDRMVINGRKTARDVYGCKGWVAHHNTNIWGQTSIEGILDSSPIWPMGGAWLSLHMWEHFAYNCDIEFLKSRAYPVMKEAAEFFIDYMVEDKSGNLVCGPSLSPENTYILPNGKTGCLCMGATMDTQIVEMLFRKCIEASIILDIDNDFRQLLINTKQKFNPNRIGKYGQLMEWSEDYDEEEVGHRHISHMFALYPGDAITENTPQILNAARTSIERRLENGGGHTGWSCAWIINMFARLKDGNKANEYINKLLTNSTYPNMLDAHPPFQIDGNFGATAGIAEMLVQSHNNYVELLPALPKQWANGKIIGLRARGGYTVDLQWENGILTNYDIKSQQGKIDKVLYCNKDLLI